MPDDRDADGVTEDDRGRRDVVVPLEVYKVVTVFSTLFAVAAVVGGFVLLDAGTDRAQAAPSDVNFAFVLAGLLAIAVGAVTYAFSTRFRTPGMGTSKDEADREPDNG